MHASVYLPLLIAGLFGLTAPRLALRLPPAAATWLLSVGGLIAAAGAAASLTLLGFTLVAQAQPLAESGHWSITALRHEDPVLAPVAAASIVAVLVLAVRFITAGVRRACALLAAHRLASGLPPVGQELAVLDDPAPRAFAVPGRPGRIAMSTGLLRMLRRDQRRAVLAHERSHLSHRHHLHQTAAVLAAAANPLLYRLPAAVALSVERWADEDAAVTCDRRSVVEALTGIATDTGAPGRSGVILAAGANDVQRRVRALQAPVARLSIWRVALLVGLLVVAVVAVREAAQDTERLFELAQAAYRSAHR
jgi:Zn-dependent protease with chaperone function